MIKSLNEECGVFGVYGHPDAARLTYYGLHSLQHRNSGLNQEYESRP